MRNPRRAYEKDGRMIQPATVGSQRALGLHRAEIWCHDCVKYREVTTDDLPAELPIPDICLAHICHLCGGRNLMSRGSVHEHYQRADAYRRRPR